MPNPNVTYGTHEQAIKEFVGKNRHRKDEIRQHREARAAITGAEWRVATKRGRQVVEVKCRTCGGFFVDVAIDPRMMDYYQEIPHQECRVCMSSALLRMHSDRHRNMAARQAFSASAAAENASEVLSRVGVPPRWRSSKLDATDALPAALIADVSAWAEQPVGMLTLMGIPGCGKTYLAVALLHHMLTHCVFSETQVMFLREADFSDMTKQIDWHKSKPKPDPRTVMMLVYDDLGSVRMDDKTKGHVVNLLERRHSDQARTIVTTNLLNMNDVATVIDPRLASRMSDRDGGMMIELPRVDLRKRARNG